MLTKVSVITFYIYLFVLNCFDTAGKKDLYWKSRPLCRPDKAHSNSTLWVPPLRTTWYSYTYCTSHVRPVFDCDLIKPDMHYSNKEYKIWVQNWTFHLRPFSYNILALQSSSWERVLYMMGSFALKEIISWNPFSSLETRAHFIKCIFGSTLKLHFIV